MKNLLALPTGKDQRHKALLSRTLKAIRRKRGLKTPDVAARMGIAPRTLQLFEAGGGRLNIARIQDFAAATDSDPLAIIVAVSIGDPTFAVRCMDNKFMTAAVLSIADLNGALGEDLALLDARLIMTEYDAAAERLGLEARRRRHLPDGGEAP